MAVCRYHPDQPGVGICMRCRVVICSACCTRLDGINYCHACLKALGRHVAPPAARLTPRLGTVVVLLLAGLFLFAAGCLLQGALAP